MPLSPDTRRQLIIAKAQRLVALGHRVIPCIGKRPVINEWQNRRLNAEELIYDLKRNDRNIAIVLNNSGWIDVECDSPKAEANLQTMFDGNIPSTVTWISPRGKHRLFRQSFRPLSHSVTKLDDIEFRGTNCKGALSIVPPSVHPDGLPYSYDGPAIGGIEIPELPQCVVDRLIEADKKQQPQAPAATGEVILEGLRNETLFRIGLRNASPRCNIRFDPRGVARRQSDPMQSAIARARN